MNTTSFEKKQNINKEVYIKYGVIDKNGKEIVSLKYDDIFNFNDDFHAKVKLGNKYSLIDTTGKCLPNFYDDLEYLKNKCYAVKRSKKWGLITSSGNKITDFEYDHIDLENTNFIDRVNVSKNGKFGLINFNGKEIIPCIYDEVTNLKNGFWIVKFKNFVALTDKYKFGIMDNNGNQITAIKYDGIKDWNLCRAKLELKDKFGCINFKSKRWIEPIYDELEFLESGLSYAGNYNAEGDNIKYCIFSIETLKETTPIKYNIWYDVSFGSSCFLGNNAIVSVWNENSQREKVGLINQNGKIIIPIEYDGLYGVNTQNGAQFIIVKDGKYSFVSKSGKIIITKKFDWFPDEKRKSKIVGIEAVNSPLLVLCKNEKYGFATRDVQEITSIKYNDIQHVYEIGAFVKYDKKWGFVNDKGLEIIPTRYESIKSLNDGFFAVETDSKFEIINYKGKILVNLKFDSIQNDWCFSEGLLRVRMNNKFGFIDQNGREIVSLKYDKVSNFKNGIAVVCMNRKYGVINKTGVEVIPVKHDEIKFFDNGHITVKSNGKWGFFDKAGKQLTVQKYSEIKDLGMEFINNVQTSVESNFFIVKGVVSKS